MSRPSPLCTATPLRAPPLPPVQYLEKTGDTKAATLHFEESGTQNVEIPRMLFENSRGDELEAYIQVHDNKELLTWCVCV